MKEIVYQNHPENIYYLITDEEFNEAMLSWEDKTPYWCNRIEAMLHNRYKYLQTPREDIGYDVFMEINPEEGDQKVFFRKGKYYVLIDENRKISIPSNQLQKLFSQEDYYKLKMYIK